MSEGRGTLLPVYLAGLYGLMIVYASLEPFSGWMAPLPGTPFFLFAPWPAHITRFDIAINIVAYLPFGFFLALIGSDNGRPILRLSIATCVAALLSFAMESAQMFLPMRDSVKVDFAYNTAGAALGAFAALGFSYVPGVHARIARWRNSVFLGNRTGDVGLALMFTWLISQVNPGIPLFAATFDPSLELTPDLAGTLLQAAQSAFNVVGIGLFLSTLLRERRLLGGAALLLIGGALVLKGCAALLLIRQSVLENWLKPGVSDGVVI